jgi:3'(2'), 5'-bisphosphate nucleotidase
MLLAQERLIGIQAVIKASRLCQNVFNKLVKQQMITKTDSSPVTIADFGAQAVVNHIIHRNFPQDPIVGIHC